MNKYTKPEFIAIIKAVLISFGSNRTYKSNVDAFLKNDISVCSSCNNFFFALNGSTDIDNNIIECEDVLGDIFEVPFELYTNENIDQMFDRYIITI